MVSDHEGKERPDPPQQGAAQFFFYLPNLSPPTLASPLPGPKPTMQFDRAVA